VQLLRYLHIGASFQDVFHDCCCLSLAWVVLQLVGEVVYELWLPLHHLAEDDTEDFREYSQNVIVEEGSNDFQDLEADSIVALEKSVCSD